MVMAHEGTTDGMRHFLQTVYNLRERQKKSEEQRRSHLRQRTVVHYTYSFPKNFITSDYGYIGGKVYRMIRFGAPNMVAFVGNKVYRMTWFDAPTMVTLVGNKVYRMIRLARRNARSCIHGLREP
ncbi:hypothetical protein HanPI659440_Chr01g0013191 [Helianthus annuus]|nr:hypothetical protein HanPI659440_Chr01g0013191 [Helianthus annuus]